MDKSDALKARPLGVGLVLRFDCLTGLSLGVENVNVFELLSSNGSSSSHRTGWKVGGASMSCMFDTDRGKTGGAPRRVPLDVLIKPLCVVARKSQTLDSSLLAAVLGGGVVHRACALRSTLE